MLIDVDRAGFFTRTRTGASPGRKQLIRRNVLASTAVLAIAMGAPASAQSESGDAAANQNDIIVTAERRETGVQKTPIAVSVFQGEDLVNRSVTNLETLSKIAPDITFIQADGAPIIAVRGISSQNTGAVGDPAIAVSTDGFYLNRPFALITSFYDIERVEVLRGPQGTLNGRNASGGAINILTVRPKSEFGGYVTAEYGNYNAVGTQGAINIPLSDSLQTRISFLTHNHDFYRKSPPQLGADDENTQSIRGQVSFAPTDRLKLWALYQYNFVGGSPGANLNIPFKYLPDGTVDHTQPDGIQDKILPSGVPQYTRLHEYTGKWNAEYDLDAVKLTYLGGYDDTRSKGQVDDTNNGKVFGFRSFQQPITWNHEFRISSASDSRLFWQVGAFYFNEKSLLISSEYYAQPGGTYARGFTYNYNIISKSLAGFGQASYKITDRLTATAGIRYTHDKKRRYGTLEIPVAAIPQDPVDYIVVAQDNTGKWNKLTYQAGLDFQITPQNMIYAKTSTGYKSGGFVPQAGYDPENVTSYEIGSKNRFAGNLLQINIAAHYENYKDQQVAQLSQLPAGGFASIIKNAGKSHIYGIESDIVLNPSENDRISASINYLHARFKDFVTVENNVNVQLAGKTLPNAPDWSLGFRVEHDIPLSVGTVTLSGDTKIQSKQYFTFFNYDSTKQGGYSISNANIQFVPTNKNWNFSLFINNIENSMVFTNAVENGFTQAYHYSFFSPRTFGGRVAYNW